jgi:glycerol dehydrogenase-like iron-containing ADH family enzyme
VFRAALASNDRDLVAALTGYLAARLHVAPRTVIAADLPQRLVAAGIGDGLAARAARVLDTLTGARHGGRGAKSDVDDAVAVVEALEEAFVRGESER